MGVSTAQWADLPAPVYDPKLPDLLARIVDLMPPGDRGRFRALYEAGAVAMHALGDLSFRRFEIADADTDDAPYAVWGEVAPIVAHTLEAVNGLLRTVHQHFPEKPTQITTHLDTAVDVVLTFAAKVDAEVGAFRDGTKKQENLADRWRLLGYLNHIRGKFRAAVGDMIFASVSVFANVSKAEVVPFFQDDIEAALQLRRGLRDLQRAIDFEIEQLRVPETLSHAAQALRFGIEAFIRSPASDHLRVLDRKVMVQTLAALRDLGKPDIVRSAIVEFLGFLDSLRAINERESLTVHDRTVVERATSSLETAREAIRSGIERAHIEVESALHMMSRLAGRDAKLDAVLERLEGLDARRLSLDELLGRIEQLEMLVRQKPTGEAPRGVG